MGSQIPDWPVRFAASFGRRLLFDPSYNSVSMEARAAWYEANLIATEYDGVFPDHALWLRFFAQRWTMEAYGKLIAELLEAGLILATDEPQWYSITGWGKYQPDPLDKGPSQTAGAKRMRKLRADRKVDGAHSARVRTVRTERTNTSPRAGASSSSSSSLSKIPPAHTRGTAKKNGEVTPGEAKALLEKYGYRPGGAPRLDSRDEDVLPSGEQGGRAAGHTAKAGIVEVETVRPGGQPGEGDHPDPGTPPTPAAGPAAL